MVEAQDGSKEGCIVVLGATGGIGSLLLKPAHLTSRDEFDATVAAGEHSHV